MGARDARKESYESRVPKRGTRDGCETGVYEAISKRGIKRGMEERYAREGVDVRGAREGLKGAQERSVRNLREMRARWAEEMLQERDSERVCKK
jgi:hypothetical protein